MMLRSHYEPVVGVVDYSEISNLAVGYEGLKRHGSKPLQDRQDSFIYRIFGQEIINYGFNRLVKDYLGWRSWLPLSVEIHHGWYIRQAPREADLKKNIPAILVFNTRQAKAWQARSHIPVYVLGAPFIHYRRRENIVPSHGARGTVVFPVHSGTKVDVDFNIDHYCDQLCRLSEPFHPINICLHEDDIKRGRHQAYLKRGFFVCSAGSRHDPEFANNFYKILASHRYATSNGPGSYVLYAVEMGLPFFFFGPKAVFNDAEFEGFESEPVLKTMNSLFKEFSPVVTEEQRRFVHAEAGVDDVVSIKLLRGDLMFSILLHPFRKLFKKVIKK